MESMLHDNERRLAVTTNWAFFGSFGLALAVSGFAGAHLVAGCAGFALFAAGFGAHVLLNHIYGTAFTKGEVALGFVVFTVAALSFVVSWLAAPAFPVANIAMGLVGFGALVACFLAYMVYHHGVRGSIGMFDRIRLNDPVFAREALAESARAERKRRARHSGTARGQR